MNFFHHQQGIVARRRSHHIERLPNSAIRPHSTTHQTHNQALVRPKDIQVMGHCSKHIIIPNEDIVDVKYSPLTKSHRMGCHFQVHLRCLQHRQETIKSFGRPNQPLLHQDNCPAHFGDAPIASQQNYFSLLRNCA
jgi:hypothetical protein